MPRHSPPLPDFALPSGAYFTVVGAIRARAGGQSRAVLTRNRLFTQHGGVESTILTFDSDPVYPMERKQLLARGELVPGMRLLNLFEFYRDATVDGSPQDEVMPDLSGFEPEDEPHPDGTVYRTKYRDLSTGRELVHDFRRADGSVYLRIPGRDGSPEHTRWILADRLSRPVQSWPHRRPMVHYWLQTLIGEHERAFVVSEGRYSASKVLPFSDDRFALIHVMHGVHMHGRRQWNTPVSPTYRFVLGSIPDLDGLVSLTTRQRQDVEQRFGATNNLFAVPHPVVPPVRPDPLPEREPARFTMVTRFDSPKRIDHAVRVFQRVVAVRPQARLHIYGGGKTEPVVRQLIGESGFRTTSCFAAGTSMHGRRCGPRPDCC